MQYCLCTIPTASAVSTIFFCVSAMQTTWFDSQSNHDNARPLGELGVQVRGGCDRQREIKLVGPQPHPKHANKES